MRLQLALAALPLSIALAAPVAASTFTYRLSGSTLTDCNVTFYQNGSSVDERSCTSAEKTQYRPPDGPTLDGLLRINESKLLAEGYDGLVNRSYSDDIEFGADDGFITPELANVTLAPVDQNFLALETDAGRRPIVWLFGFNDVAFLFEPGPATFFINASFPNPESENPVPGRSRSGYAIYDGEPLFGNGKIVRWNGEGGTLALVPLPLSGLLLLTGLGALAAMARQTNPIAHIDHSLHRR